MHQTVHFTAEFIIPSSDIALLYPGGLMHELQHDTSETGHWLFEKQKMQIIVYLLYSSFNNLVMLWCMLTTVFEIINLYNIFII